jgi:putative endonuclease
MPFTYILFSEKLDKYYIGSCIDLERRLYEHNIGHSKFTSLGVPWKIEYVEEFPTTQQAKARELEIKRMKSRKYIQELIAKGRASRF